MAAVRHHCQRRRRDLAFHQHRGRKAGPVLVAGQHQRRDSHRAHLVDQVIERRPLALAAELGVGRAQRRVLGQRFLELGEAARILVLELNARRSVGILPGEGRHALVLQRPGHDADLGLELRRLVLLRAIADAGHDQRSRPRRVAEAEVEAGEAAHRQADHMRLVDPEMIHHRQDVVGGAVLAVALGLLRYIGRRIAPRAVGDAAIALAEMAHLHFPRAVVGREFVDEHDGRPRAGLLEIERYAIVGRCIRHQ